MLVMTIKEGEFLKIGSDIHVEIIKDMSAGQVKVGVDAPRSMKILRSRVYEEDLLKDAESNAEEIRQLEERKAALEKLIAERKQKTAYVRDKLKRQKQEAM